MKNTKQACIPPKKNVSVVRIFLARLFCDREKRLKIDFNVNDYFKDRLKSKKTGAVFSGTRWECVVETR
jgi:hypothetical protein